MNNRGYIASWKQCAGEHLPCREALMRKLVRSLNDLDNFFFEIRNEPRADRATAAHLMVNKEDLRDGGRASKADLAGKISLEWQRDSAPLTGNIE